MSIPLPKIICRTIYLLIILAVLYGMCRILIVDRFHVGGNSMEPTLNAGDPLWVEKWTLGARIYTSFDFDTSELSSFRMPGLGRLSPGDIAVFNSPDGGQPGKIGFKINYVYAKRIIGTPGDTVQIIGGFYHNSSVPGRLLCPSEGQARLGMMPAAEADSVKMYRESINDVPWSARSFGPMAVPAKGCSMTFDSVTAAAYAMAVEYECGRRPEEGETYTFKKNWYFFGGDYVLNSRDSRYFGLIPEDYIVGRVLSLAHRDRRARGLRKKDTMLEEALAFSGTNRGELEKVLFHYRGNPEKLRAAEWLIRNMPCHYGYAPSAAMDSAKAVLQDIRIGKTVEEDRKRRCLSVNESALTKIYDSRVITAEYLIDNIDRAFKVRDKRPWNRALSFDDFCEMLLPYRVGTEPLENWRAKYEARYGYVLDTLYRGRDIMVACDSLNKALEQKFLLEERLQAPDLGPLFLLDTRVGGCQEVSGFSLYLLRSLGIPAATDFFRKDVVHLWTVAADTTGRKEFLRLFAEYSGDPQVRGKVDFRTKGKVYRKTFAPEQGRLFKDVSAEYFGDFTCEVPLEKRTSETVWLGMFTGARWLPMEPGKTEGKKVSFSSFEPGMVYAPVNENGREMGFPFIRYPDGSLERFVPGPFQEGVSVSRKTRLTGRIRGVMAESAGTIIEGALDADFSDIVWRDTLPGSHNQYNHLYPEQKLRYIRLRSPKGKPLQMAEIRVFRDRERAEPLPFVIETGAQAMGDSDELTYYRASAPDVPAVLDLGREIYVAMLEWTPRNDDNFIRRGDVYELQYNNGPSGWVGLGRQEAADTVLHWNSVPQHALLRLHDLTRGREEDAFIFRDGRQQFVSWNTP